MTKMQKVLILLFSIWLITLITIIIKGISYEAEWQEIVDNCSAKQGTMVKKWNNKNYHCIKSYQLME